VTTAGPKPQSKGTVLWCLWVFTDSAALYRTRTCQVDELLVVPSRSAVVGHHRRGPLGFTRVAIARRSAEFLNSGHGFPAQGHRLTCDACLAEPFEVGLSSIERVNKLAQRSDDGIAILHRLTANSWIAARRKSTPVTKAERILVHSEAAVQMCTADLQPWHVRIGLVTLAPGAEAGGLS